GGGGGGEGAGGAGVAPERGGGGGPGARAWAVLDFLRGGEPQRARHRAVVRDDVLLAEPLLERRRGALDESPRVDEHDRRAMLRDQLGDPIVDARELLVRRDRAELVVGDLDREVELAAMAGVDDV